MANEILANGMMGFTNMAVPTTSLTETPNARGQTMAETTYVPMIPGVTFDARGRGRWELGARVSGKRGTIDLLLDMGAVGTARTICYLTDSLTSPTNFIAVRIDTSNRPLVTIKNNLGTTVGAVTPSYTAIPANKTSVLVRFTWDSTAAVNGTRFASLRVNQEHIPAGNWSTDPLASWAHFKPTHLVMGASLSDADFNGTILACQVSDLVTL